MICAIAQRLRRAQRTAAPPPVANRPMAAKRAAANVAAALEPERGAGTGPARAFAYWATTV